MCGYSQRLAVRPPNARAGEVLELVRVGPQQHAMLACDGQFRCVPSGTPLLLQIPDGVCEPKFWGLPNRIKVLFQDGSLGRDEMDDQLRLPDGRWRSLEDFAPGTRLVVLAAEPAPPRCQKRSRPMHLARSLRRLRREAVAVIGFLAALLHPLLRL